MKKYHNNWFYNIAMPHLLMLAVLGCGIAFAITNRIFFVIMMLILCLCFKSLNHLSEGLSIKQRQDYGLINKHGVYYPYSLSGKNKSEIEEIRKEWVK